MRRWVYGLILSLLLTACAPWVVATNDAVAPDATATVRVRVTAGSAEVAGTPGRDEPATEVVVFTRGGGLTGETQTWTIYTDGTVKLADDTGNAAQALTGVTAEQVGFLLTGLEALKFFDLNDTYGANDQCADCYQYSLTVTSNGRTKTVTTHDAASDAPPELAQALELIQGLLATTS